MDDSLDTSLNRHIACRAEDSLRLPSLTLLRVYGVPPPGSTTATKVPRQATGKGAEVGGEEKAVSSNPGTRGATEHDALLFAVHRGSRCNTPCRESDDSVRFAGICVVTLRTSSFHEGALGKRRHPL